MSEAKRTTNHLTIRQWVEERRGHPASVKDTGLNNHPGLLRVDFDDGESDANLQPVDWDDFFEQFDKRGLEFLYQEQTESGQMSRFCKFMNKPR